MKAVYSLLLLWPVFLLGQVTIYEDVEYDVIDDTEPNLLSMDVYVPDGDEPKPIAIYVHGGGWCIGDKSNVHHKAELLTSMGYLFASINYRLSPIPFELDNLDRIMYPDHPTDVAKAIGFILDRAEQYGGDTERVFLFGHSSGAHLVATVLADQSFLEGNGYSPSAIRCACIMDTGGFDLPSWITEKATDPDLFKNAFGSDEETWQEASPTWQVEEGDALPHLLLIYQDNFNRIVANQDFAAAVRQRTTSEVEELSTAYDHQQINQLLGATATAAEAAYTDSFVDWLTPCMQQTVSTNTTKVSTTDILLSSAVYDHITFSSATKGYIFDTFGNVVMEVDAKEGQSISIAHLPAASYMLTTNQGMSQRMVVIK